MLFFIWVLISIALLFFYLYEILISYIKWNTLPVDITTCEPFTSFSIIIPVRNEEDNILSLIDNIAQLNYPKHLWELILVDDHSNDNTLSLINTCIDNYKSINIVVYSIYQDDKKTAVALKKSAISTGVAHAKFDWIVTSDADCWHHQNYLIALNEWVIRYQPQFISAPVVLSGNSIFQNMQAAEFMGLVGLGASYIHREKPVLSNGANTAYQKNAFQIVNGFKNIQQNSSGDDVWLMHKIHTRFPYQLLFAKDERLIVSTYAANSFSEFWNQRKRWSSKNTDHKDYKILLMLSAHYLFYVSLLMNIIFAVFIPEIRMLTFIAIIAKLLVEALFFKSLNTLFKKDKLLLWYFIAFLPQAIYTVLIVPFSQFSSFEWKNRKLKK